MLSFSPVKDNGDYFPLSVYLHTSLTRYYSETQRQRHWHSVSSIGSPVRVYYSTFLGFLSLRHTMDHDYFCGIFSILAKEHRLWRHFGLHQSYGLLPSSLICNWLYLSLLRLSLSLFRWHSAVPMSSRLPVKWKQHPDMPVGDALGVWGPSALMWW